MVGINPRTRPHGISGRKTHISGMGYLTTIADGSIILAMMAVLGFSWDREDVTDATLGATGALFVAMVLLELVGRFHGL